MRLRIEVHYKHWTDKDKEYKVQGLEVPTNALSDRIVIEKDDGTFEDILKETIISKRIL
jgi:hypothetical protein